MLLLQKDCDRSSGDWLPKHCLQQNHSLCFLRPYVVTVDTPRKFLICIRHTDPTWLHKKCEALLCFFCPEQIKEVPFGLTESLLRTELCKRACRISLYQGKQPGLLSDLKYVVRMTLPPIKSTPMSLGYSVNLER